MNRILVRLMHQAAICEAMMAYDLMVQLNVDGAVNCINKVLALGKFGPLSDAKKSLPGWLYFL